jgi:hypothetical protein
MNKLLASLVYCFFILISVSTGCSPKVLSPSEIENQNKLPDRESLIPVDAVKMSFENDPLPPELLSDEFEPPVPLPYPVNTRGAEDSPFILPDGDTLFVWFTPSSSIDASEQVKDQVTGIYIHKKQSNGWSAPERIWLAHPDEAHLDGCGFFQDDKLWFCGVRQGLEGMHWFTSILNNGQWTTPVLSDFDPEFEVGELHFSKDGKELFFHSRRPGGRGGLDIWISRKVDEEWQEPVNLENVNSEFDEGWPALNPQENELWISKNYGLWRSLKVNGEWQVPELIISSMAGEATLDEQGNVYFTHHFFKGDKMIEADIYVAIRKKVAD